MKEELRKMKRESEKTKEDKKSSEPSEDKKEDKKGFLESQKIADNQVNQGIKKPLPNSSGKNLTTQGGK